MKTKEILQKSESDNDEFIQLDSPSNLLSSYGINAGDKVFVQRLEENDPEQITVWQLVADGTMYAGFASTDFGDCLLTINQVIQTYKKSEVKLIGKIVAYMKLFDARDFSAGNQDRFRMKDCPEKP